MEFQEVMRIANDVDHYVHRNYLQYLWHLLQEFAKIIKEVRWHDASAYCHSFRLTALSSLVVSHLQKLSRSHNVCFLAT